MYGFPLFFRMVMLSLTTGKGRAARLTPKRFLLECLIVPVLFFAKLAHSLGFLLDELLFPGYRKVEIEEPVFVVGIPRSGTTMLHRLMAQDEEQFTTFKFWELALAPSIIERKLLMALGRVDRALGEPGRRLIQKLEGRLLAGLHKIHYISLFSPEEDDFVLMHQFASVFLLFALPYMEEGRGIIFFDTMMPPEARKRLMAYYRRCVQRHLYVHGPGKRLLSKNPSFSAKVDSLAETFPDAKIVCCVRTPYAAVPSFTSLMSYVWGLPPGYLAKGGDVRQSLLDAADHFYRHPMERLPALPENRHAFILYDALTQSPKETVTGLYERLGLVMRPEYAQKLDAHAAKARTYKSKHSYALDDIGLTPHDIRENYRYVFERYGFDTEDGTAG